MEPFVPVSSWELGQNSPGDGARRNNYIGTSVVKCASVSLQTTIQLAFSVNSAFVNSINFGAQSVPAMADYQFHSSDCPLWHPEKFAAAGSSSSRCWCQRWSNLVEWNVAAEGSNDGMVLPEVKKEALPAKIAPKPRQNPAPILQTDAFLGSNLWPAEELKFEQDASVDLDLLWKKLDGAAENSQLAAAGGRKASSSRDSPGSASPPFLSRMDTMSRSADGFGLSLPSGSPMSMSSVGSCLDALSLNMATDNSGLDHLVRSPLDMDPSSLFDDPLLPATSVLPSPLIPQTVSAPCISPEMAGSVSSVEVDSKPTPKRRGRPPGKANARKGSESTEGGREPKRSRKRSPSFSDSMDSDYFDTTGYVISTDDLKPVPVIRKSKKKLTPEEAKDEKYWARRRKNNLAAKRSRDIRRLKENQIALRAAFLESENLRLKTELDDMRTDNEALRLRLEAYEGVKH